jgi:hypothetical protein
MSRHTLSLINKVFALQFYRLNSSLFFLIIAFAGGFMRSYDHIALGQLLTSSPLLTLVPASIWLLFGIFIVNFNKKIIAMPENNFLRCFPLLPATGAAISIAGAVLLQMMPVILYATFLLLLSLERSDAIPLFILAELVLAIAVPMGMLSFNLISLCARDAAPKQRMLWSKRLAKPYPLILIQGVLSRDPLSLTGYKVLSVFILLGGLHVSAKPIYDLRLIALAATISFHLALSFISEWHRFENDAFSIYRRMPFSNLQRLGYAVMIILLFSLPELLVLWKNFPIHLTRAGKYAVCLYGLSIYLFWYCFHFVRDWRQETAISFGAIAAIGNFIMILAGIPVFIITMANISISTAIFLLCYYRFEYTRN